MRLTARELQAAFKDAHPRFAGEVDWERFAENVNQRLHDNLVGHTPELAGKHRREPAG